MSESRIGQIDCSAIGRNCIALLVAPMVSLALAGCSQPGVDVIPVAGKVLLNGEPLVGADVIFKPTNGRPSMGTTDSEGQYKLKYTSERLGALPGRHKVSISTAIEADPDATDPRRRAGSRERVPVKYNSRTTLEVEVGTERPESFDFKLESAGATQAKR